MDRLEHSARQILEVDLAREPAPLVSHRTIPAAIFLANLPQHLPLPLVALRQPNRASVPVAAVFLVSKSLLAVAYSAQPQALGPARASLVLRITLAADLAQGQAIQTQDSALEEAFSGNRTIPSNSNQSLSSAVVLLLLLVGDLAPPALDSGPATRALALVEVFSAIIQAVHLVNHNSRKIQIHSVEVLARLRIKIPPPQLSVHLDSHSSRSKSQVGYSQLHRPPTPVVVSSVISAIIVPSSRAPVGAFLANPKTTIRLRRVLCSVSQLQPAVFSTLLIRILQTLAAGFFRDSTTTTPIKISRIKEVVCSVTTTISNRSLDCFPTPNRALVVVCSAIKAIIIISSKVEILCSETTTNNSSRWGVCSDLKTTTKDRASLDHSSNSSSLTSSHHLRY